MTESVRTRHRTDRGPGPGAPLADPSSGGEVTVSSGLFHDRLPVGGMSVADVRERFADRLDIDPAATAVIDGEPVADEGTVIRAGQALSFFQYAGEKGTGSPCGLSSHGHRR